MLQFSVLMSVYKNEKDEFLDEALNSLAIQTCPADEIILVIDGNIPESLHKIINKWIPKLPLIIVKLPENVGLGNALNKGLVKAKFDIVARMDTDDICVPERFEKQIAYFEENPEITLLGGAINEFDSTLSKSHSVKLSCVNHDDIVKFSIRRNPFNHMTMMFRKEQILFAGNYQHHPYMEDYNLWLRCIFMGAHCHNLSDVLVHARAGSEMISRRRGKGYIRSEFKLALLKTKCFPRSIVNITFVTFLRIVSRVLPVKLLTLVYKSLRS